VPGRSEPTGLGEQLRLLFRSFPAGVAVITVDVGGQRLGLTVGSLVSLSLDPPLVGVSVSHQAAMHSLLAEAESFAASLLAAGQEAVAQHFARGVPPFAHWHGIALREVEGAPLVAGALGWVRCRRASHFETGDHGFFVGEVVEVEAGQARQPLVYFRQDYRAL
jgi:flavin reductase (DIM6/NTAB) family NADH-FMN oxidoreductase RutF